MKQLILILLILISSPLWALSLKIGDIVLQPLNCWSCTLIEAQERSIYSHMGLVIETTPEVRIVEALDKVRVLSLDEFNARTEKGQKLSVRRLKDNFLVAKLQYLKKDFQKFYFDSFHGLDYDHDFLWDNIGQSGQEKLYCSEMITKLLGPFLGITLPTKIMKYDINRELWVRYFKGLPPDGKIGNAPADFERSNLFYEVGKL